MVVSVGNSRLAIGVFVAGELTFVRRVGLEQRADWQSVIKDAWQRLAAFPDAGVAGATVNPTVTAVVEHTVKEATGKQIEWAGVDFELPMKVLTETPATTGVDRVLNVAAAFEQMQAACVVVDAGTALTIDVCNSKGEFLGGAILPGAKTMLDALSDRTAKLPRVSLTKPVGLIGKNTEQAMLNGVFYGLRGVVKEIVENFATELGSWPDIICTGGDATMLFEGWELAHAVSPDLTLYGVALAYAEHYAVQE